MNISRRALQRMHEENLRISGRNVLSGLAVRENDLYRYELAKSCNGTACNGEVDRKDTEITKYCVHR